MHFNCCFSDAEVTGNLFVQLAGDDMLEHFPLARCKRLETGADFGKFGLFQASDSVSFNRCANRCEQIFVLHWLRKEIKRAMFHRLHALRYITVTGEKNNRQDAAFLGERSLKLKAVEVRHSNIKHDAYGRGWMVLLKKFPG